MERRLQSNATEIRLPRKSTSLFSAFLRGDGESDHCYKEGCEYYHGHLENFKRQRMLKKRSKKRRIEDLQRGFGINKSLDMIRMRRIRCRELGDFDLSKRPWAWYGLG
jgi:hypothetical protein